MTVNDRNKENDRGGASRRHATWDQQQLQEWALGFAHLKSEIEAGGMPPARSIVWLLTSLPDEPGPEWLDRHIESRLSSELEGARLRFEEAERDLLRLTFIRYLVWLRRRAASRGLKGWFGDRKPDWWAASASTSALFMLIRRSERARELTREQLLSILDKPRR